MKSLRCYLVRWSVDEKERGVFCVIDGSEEEARATASSYFDYLGMAATIGRITSIPLEEGAYEAYRDRP